MTTVAENTLLTAYNQDIQRFISPGSFEKRDEILQHIEAAVLATGKSFAKLFPPKTKRKDVMKRILLLLSGGGICKVESKTLAKQIGCTVRTVTDAVAKLKETDEILVCGLADGKNKYVFVLKSHPDFKAIIKEVFSIDELPENDATSEQISEQISYQKNAKSVGAVSPNRSKLGSMSFKSLRSLRSKQEVNIYIASAIENEIISSKRDAEKEAEMVATYYTNDFQHLLYKNYRNDYTLSPEIRETIAILGLRLGSNCTIVQYVKAFQTIMKIDDFIKQGGKIREGIPALFSNIYKNGLKMDEYARIYKEKNAMIPLQDQKRVKRVPLYNWLKHRG